MHDENPNTAHIYATYPSLRGRAVLVTGGATGIGASIVTEFARQGARVAFFDVQDEAAAALAGSLRSELGPMPVYFHCDLTDVSGLQAAVRDAVAELGAVDVLVNNAANDERHRIEGVTPEYRAEIMASQALKREIEPEDVARLVLFLAADDSEAITNQSYVIDAGWV